MSEVLSSLETSIQEKLDADTDFQASLAELSDEDKQNAIQTKKSELLETEIATLKEMADKAAKAEEIANNQKIRAEKAEQELKKNKPAGDVTPKNTENLSPKDVIYLASAGIHPEDLDEVMDWARFKKISIPESHKQLKATLELKAEQRKTADALNVGVSKRSTAKIPDDVLLTNASKGILPDNDEDLARLFNLRKPKKTS